VHDTQLPDRQTRFVPQPTPSARGVPESWQLELPVVQVSVPEWQGLPGVQAPPAVQAVHVPLLQTWLVPQAVPFGTFPVSAQTDTPVAHEVAPVRHGFGGWQVAPAVQATQVPLLQTWFVPHATPSARFVPVSVHAIAGEQACFPAWHGFGGVHDNPVVHDKQLPALQTMFVPHEVPFAWFPASAHTGTPVLHVVVPVRQGFPETAQLAPTVQSPQAPAAEQTLSVPQLVPAGSGVPLSLQTGVPVEQASAP